MVLLVTKHFAGEVARSEGHRARSNANCIVDRIGNRRDGRPSRAFTNTKRRGAGGGRGPGSRGEGAGAYPRFRLGSNCHE